MITNLRKHLLLLWKAQNGNALMLVSLSMVLIITAVGAAVDMSRLQTLQAKMSSALDAAGLAAGATVANIDPNSSCYPGVGVTATPAQTQCWAQQQAQRYFDANFPAGYLNSSLPSLSVETGGGITPSGTACPAGSICLSATSTQPTTFLKIVNSNPMGVAANSVIAFEQNPVVEVALVMDNTGSMTAAVNNAPVSASNPSKISALISNLTGAGGLIPTISGGQSKPSNIFIGLVPFAAAVNIASGDLPSILGASNYSNQAPYINSTINCVDARSNYIQSTSTASTTLNLTPSTLPSNGTTVNLYLDEANDTPTTAPAFFNLMTYYESGYNSGNNCPPAAVQSLTNDMPTITNAINAMTAKGSTLLNIGMAWGWRLIAPNWSGTWVNAPSYNGNKLPLSSTNTTNLKQVVIFMTDGMDNYDDYGAYGDVSSMSGEINITNYPTETTTGNVYMDNNFLAICSALKNAGVTVFTIGYGTDIATIQPIPPTLVSTNDSPSGSPTGINPLYTNFPADWPNQPSSTLGSSGHCVATLPASIYTSDSGCTTGNSYSKTYSFPAPCPPTGCPAIIPPTTIPGTPFTYPSESSGSPYVFYYDGPASKGSSFAQGPSLCGTTTQCYFNGPLLERQNTGVYVNYSLLTECASQGDAYLAPSNTALQTAFSKIAAQITALRISQ